MKILYVEDSANHIATVQRIATFLKHELITATTGAQARERIKERPDLVLLDINLPDANGLDLARQWRTERYSMPIVAITADVYLYTEEQAVQAGCTVFIAKPYTVDTIKNLFNRYNS